MILHDKPSIFYSPCSVSHGSARRPCRPRRSSLTHREPAEPDPNPRGPFASAPHVPHAPPAAAGRPGSSIFTAGAQEGQSVTPQKRSRRTHEHVVCRSGSHRPTRGQGRGMHCASLAGAQGRGRTTLGGVHTADRAASPPRPFPRPAGSEKLDVSSREYKLRVYCQENRRLGKTIGEARG